MPKKKDTVSKAVRQYNQLQKQVAQNTAQLKQTVEGKQIYRSAAAQAILLNSFNKYEILDGLAQGVADVGTGATVSTGARIGNSINVKSITLRMMLDGANLTASVSNPQAKTHGNYRVIVYNSPCGEDLTEQDILKDNSTTDIALKSHYKIQVGQGKMYEIWSDRTFCLSDAFPCKNLDFTKRWKNGKKVMYDGNSTTPSNFRPKVLIIGDDNANVDRFSYSFKVRYEDL